MEIEGKALNSGLMNFLIIYKAFLRSKIIKVFSLCIPSHDNIKLQHLILKSLLMIS